jgi:hypothetical protein
MHQLRGIADGKHTDYHIDGSLCQECNYIMCFWEIIYGTKLLQNTEDRTFTLCQNYTLNLRAMRAAVHYRRAYDLSMRMNFRVDTHQNLIIM